jgi:hypothetical protein
VLNGNDNQASASSYVTIVNGLSGRASGERSTILTGEDNVVSSIDGVVLTGIDNDVTGDRALIASGNSNEANGPSSVVLSGVNNEADAGAGTSCCYSCCLYRWHCCLLGSPLMCTNAKLDYAVIATGLNNRVFVDDAVVLTGSGNTAGDLALDTETAPVVISGQISTCFVSHPHHHTDTHIHTYIHTHQRDG